MTVVSGDITTEEGATKIVKDALEALDTAKIDILGMFLANREFWLLANVR